MEIMIRKCIAVILAAVALTMVPAPRAGDALSRSAQDAPAAFAITHGPYLQLPSSSSMTLVWHTNRKAVSKVEYGIGDDLGMTAVTSRYGLIENDNTSHVVRLTGLKPGTKYRYRVVSREFLGYQQQHIVSWGETVSSPVYAFATLDPDKEAFSFAMVSDIHERGADLEALLGMPDAAKVDFLLFNGDMLNDFMRADQVFQGFLDVSVRLFAKEMPFIYSRGNHETRGRFARILPDILPAPEGRTYFSFNHGGAHFIVLDSGEDKEDAHPYYNGLVDFQEYRKAEAVWLKQDLESDAFRKARYRIVISHIPPRAAKGFAIEEVGRNFEPLILKAGVDLWLSGHTHRFQRVDPAEGQNNYTLIIGSTDTLTRVEVAAVGIKVSAVRQNGEVLLPALQLPSRWRDR
jgi:predicted phosphodiesterase